MTAIATTIPTRNPAATSSLLTLRVDGFRAEARDVISLELVNPRGGYLPPFTPGAHVDVHLPNGMVRQYSLCGIGGDAGRYRIAVARVPQSRGGSAYIHDAIRRGTELLIGGPRNNFPLVNDAEHYRFIAGGIGITPILPMLHWCAAAGTSWTLFYCSQTRQRAAFIDDIGAIPGGRMIPYFDNENGGNGPDLASALGPLRPREHVYCCGPGGLMAAVSRSISAADRDRLHFEWFTAVPDARSPGDSEFEIVLGLSGQVYKVPPGRSILEVLEENGHLAAFGCRSGFCGCCETRLLAGEPDHRDNVLPEAVRAANQTIMICVSRARGRSLTLDI